MLTAPLSPGYWGADTAQAAEPEQMLSVRCWVMASKWSCSAARYIHIIFENQRHLMTQSICMDHWTQQKTGQCWLYLVAGCLATQCQCPGPTCRDDNDVLDKYWFHQARGEKPGTGTTWHQRAGHSTGEIFCVYGDCLGVTTPLFHKTDGRLICLLRGSENGNPDAFCDMSRPCHKNRQNLIIDLTISVFCVWETSQIDPVQIDAIFRKNILNIRCCVNLWLTSKWFLPTTFPEKTIIRMVGKSSKDDCSRTNLMKAIPLQVNN